MRMGLSAHINQCAFQGVNFTCLLGRIPILIGLDLAMNTECPLKKRS